MKSIGILAGTFDPVHKGHIAFAETAIQKCNLGKVFFLPERKPRDKNNVTDFTHRVQMLKLATAPHEDLEVLELGDNQFTVKNTLPKLQQIFAGSELTLLIGSDITKALANWPNLEKLLSTAQLAIALRSASEEGEIKEVLNSLNLPVKATFISSPHAQISASQIRFGKTKNIVDPVVLKYIQSHRLYKGELK